MATASQTNANVHQSLGCAISLATSNPPPGRLHWDEKLHVFVCGVIIKHIQQATHRSLCCLCRQSYFDVCAQTQARVCVDSTNSPAGKCMYSWMRLELSWTSACSFLWPCCRGHTRHPLHAGRLVLRHRKAELLSTPILTNLAIHYPYSSIRDRRDDCF